MVTILGHHNIVPLYKEVTLQYQMSRDADSGEMIDIIFSGVAFDFGVIGWQNTCGNKIIEGLYIPKSTDVASLAASLQSTLAADADKLKTATALVP